MNEKEIEQAKSKVKAIESEISKLAEEKSKLNMMIANAECPFKVGQKIIDQDGVKMIVSEVYSRYGRYRVKAKRIKKNGEPYVQSNELWWPERCKHCNE